MSNKNFSSLLETFLQHLKGNSYARSTRDNFKRRLNYFFSWLESHGFKEVNEITAAIIEKYQVYVCRLKKKDGKPYASAEQHARSNAISIFFSWLTKKNHILYNPAADMVFPKVSKMLPTNILTIEEAEKIMQVPDITTKTGLRDRAIVEVFYATGIRRSELVNLKISHINFNKETLLVKGGKGEKDRMLPISKRALHWLEQYLEKSRPLFPLAESLKTLFLSKYGKPYNRAALGTHIREIIRKANIGKTGSCHIFRHTNASHLLEAGMELRYIQEMLGHSALSTTQIYTKVSIGRLKAIHNQTHPSAKIKKRNRKRKEDTHE